MRVNVANEVTTITISIINLNFIQFRCFIAAEFAFYCLIYRLMQE